MMGLVASLAALITVSITFVTTSTRTFNHHVKVTGVVFVRKRRNARYWFILKTLGLFDDPLW